MPKHSHVLYSAFNTQARKNADLPEHKALLGTTMIARRIQHFGSYDETTGHALIRLATAAVMRSELRRLHLARHPLQCPRRYSKESPLEMYTQSMT